MQPAISLVLKHMQHAASVKILCDMTQSNRTWMLQSHRCCIFILSISCRVELGKSDCEHCCSPLMHAAQIHEPSVPSLTACLKCLHQLSRVPGQSASEASYMPAFWILNHSQLADGLPFCRNGERQR